MQDEERGQEPTETTEEAANQAESQEETTLSPEDLARELKKTRREAAKYRTELQSLKSKQEQEQEAKRQAELTAEERAREAERKAEEAIKAAEERVLHSERTAKLAGKVTNPQRVIKLMDDPSEFFNDKGELDEKALAKAFPEYLPQRSNATGGSSHENRPIGKLNASIDDQIRRKARGG